MTVPLLVVDRLGAGLFETVVLALNLLKGVVGIAIAAIAYRGYRRNGSRPMLFISVGFALALGIPVFLVFGGLTIVQLADLSGSVESTVSMTSELCQVLGLFVILYALRI